MEMIKKVEFEISSEIKSVEIDKLVVWRVSSLIIDSIKINSAYSNRILGINFKSNVERAVLANSFKGEKESFGIRTVNYLNDNLPYFDFGILNPAGFDFNSIKYVLQEMIDMPLLVILDSRTYYELFNDAAYGDIYSYKSLVKRQISNFKVV